MKQRFSLLILVSAFAGVFAACNNGPYDAHPDFDGSGVQNPINPTLSAAKGTIKARVNGGQFKTFTNAKFIVQDSMRAISGVYAVEGELLEFLYLTVWRFKGNTTYQISDTTLDSPVVGSYATMNGTDTSSQQVWSTNYVDKRGTGEIKVELSNADEIKGTFRFIAYRVMPEDTTNKVDITEGSFWAEKQQ